MEGQGDQSPNKQEHQSKEMTHLHQEDRDKLLKRHYTQSVRTLNLTYGVDNLTPIEAVHLRRILRDCLTFDKTESKRTLSNFVPWQEAIDRWFFQLYHINGNDIPMMTELTDKEGNKFLFKLSDEDHAEEKRMSLFDQNNLIALK